MVLLTKIIKNIFRGKARIMYHKVLKIIYSYVRKLFLLVMMKPLLPMITKNYIIVYITRKIKLFI